jgi:hypothetical protein
MPRDLGVYSADDDKPTDVNISSKVFLKKLIVVSNELLAVL